MTDVTNGELPADADLQPDAAADHPTAHETPKGTGEAAAETLPTRRAT
jgi:hypothetical protein